MERMIAELYGSPTGQAEAQMLESIRDVVIEIELWIGKDDYLLRKSLQETSNPSRALPGRLYSGILVLPKQDTTTSMLISSSNRC